MTPQQITLVRDTFGMLAPAADAVAARFYQHLFSDAPQLRPLFKGDMQRQGQRLMAMVGAAVRLLDQPASLKPTLDALGVRHIAYGVEDEHYDQVGVALLKTLGDALGECFTLAVHDAWAAVYGFIAHEMKTAAAVHLAIATGPISVHRPVVIRA